MRTIYLDHAAATPLREEVRSAMLPFLERTYGNPSSIHLLGREASNALATFRERAARALEVSPDEIIFTGSGTEANNLALEGVVTKPAHFLLSAIEHPSVLETGVHLEHTGHTVEYIPVGSDGRIDIEDTISRVREDTALISVMYANNEIGVIEPIRELADALTVRFGEARPLLHTDACQAGGQLPISPRDLGVDLMTINSTKLYGPKGVGLLYVRNGVRLTPHTHGGHHEFGLRAGTENLLGISGFVTALELAVQEQDTSRTHLTTLRDLCIEELTKRIPDVVLNGHPTLRLPNNVHVSFPAIEGESLVLLLDTYDICASTGSACNAHNLLPSHVLRAIDQSPNLIHGSLRLTLGKDTTEDDIYETVRAVHTSVARLTALSPIPLHL